MRQQVSTSSIFDAAMRGNVESFKYRIWWFNVVSRYIQDINGKLNLSRLGVVSVASSSTIHDAIAGLEKAVGHELVAARNGEQAAMPAFLVDLGSVDVIFLIDELIYPERLKSDQKTADSIWHIASTLANVDYYARLKEKFAGDVWLSRAQANPVAARDFAMAKSVLSGYWRGLLGYVGAMATVVPFDALVDALDTEISILDTASIAHAHTADLFLLADRMFEATSFLFEGMAQAAGYLDGADKTAQSAARALSDRMHSLGVAGDWNRVSEACRRLYAQRDSWTTAADLMPIAQLAREFLKARGLTVETGANGLASVTFLPVDVRLH